MPFHSNAWLTREKEIRYGTRLKKMPPITFIPQCSRINVKCYQLFVSENIAWILTAWVELYEKCLESSVMLVMPKQPHAYSPNCVSDKLHK